MNFISVDYMVFLAAAAFIYFAVPQKYRNVYLLAASYIFYFLSESRFFVILPFLSAVTFFGGKRIGRREKPGRVFTLTLAANLAVLIFFKYNGFFLDVMSSLTGKRPVTGRLILPMGLSFYTFMAVTYLADLRMKKYRPEENPVKLFLYLAFFPHVLMGPIDRADRFLPQLDEIHLFDYKKAKRGAQLMALGFFKKCAVADVLAMTINRVHRDIASYGGAMLVFTAVLYSFQLYGDFSGYSDIARGSGLIMGFDLAENFNAPYLSTSFSRFWSRWHISLSSRFQDYIFTPLVWTNPFKKLPVVGRFFERPPVLPAVAAVFITSGLWHGNTLNFLVWGLCHGVFRIAEELIRRRRKPDRHPGPVKYRCKALWVFSLVTFSQIFFRCRDMPSAFLYIRRIFCDFRPGAFFRQLKSAVGAGFDYTPLLIYAYLAFCRITLSAMIALDCIKTFKIKGKCLTVWLDSLPAAGRWLCYYAIVGLVLAGFIMNNGGYGASASFIYNGF